MTGTVSLGSNGSAPAPGEPLPADAEAGKDDGLLESIGKAISSPVKGAAEAEEPGHDPDKPPVAPA